MALSFAKKAAGASSSTQTSTQTKTTSEQAKSPSSGVSFMKKGAAAKQAIAEDEAKAELQKQERDKLWRFYLKPNEDRKIVFLDGEVDDDGMLDINMFHEHSVKINGSWEQFVCTAEIEGHCPICERGESKPYLVGCLTVIDLTPYKIKNGPKAGQEVPFTKKLFVAKKQTLGILSKIAVKRDGLTGALFDVSRGDDKTAAVGSQFDFTEKGTLVEIAEQLGVPLETVQPADYTHEITYRTSEELVKLGAGKAPSGMGHESGVVDKKKLASEL